MVTTATGIDHIYVSVSDMERSEEFYDRVMPVLGFRKSTTPIGGDPHVHYYGAYFGYSLRPARAMKVHDPYSPGLHHFCFRVDSVEDLQQVYAALTSCGVVVSAPKNYPEYAPDYFAIFFEDPDGIRLEVTNYREQRRRHLRELAHHGA